MFRRLSTIALALGVAVGGGSCSTPNTEAGSLGDAKEQVVRLVLDAAHALPANSTFDPPTKVGTQSCKKTVFGYVVGSTGAHRIEVPLIVKTPEGQSPTRLLGRIAAAWTEAGYRLDRSRLDETQFPQLRAHAPGGYDVVATAFTNAPQIDLYAVSQCFRGS